MQQDQMMPADDPQMQDDEEGSGNDPQIGNPIENRPATQSVMSMVSRVWFKFNP